MGMVWTYVEEIDFIGALIFYIIYLVPSTKFPTQQEKTIGIAEYERIT